MKNERFIRLILIAVPWLIIGGMIFGAYLPVLRGEKYLLPVKPRDPREFFRGNYVDLQYDFSRLEREKIRIELDTAQTYRFGDSLYLDLEKDGSTLRPVALVHRPELATHIRLKVQPRWSITAKDSYFDLLAGLESFFAPKKDALDWENALREGKVFAEVAIDRNGNARLVRLVKTESRP